MSSPSLSHSFEEKRVLVTGGGRGIGEGIVRKFYNDGATVFVLDKDQSLLDKLKNELPKIQTICVDLLNWEATQEAVLAITPLDHLVNNAGDFRDGSTLSITEDKIDYVFGVNVKAVICVTQAFVNGNIKCNSAEGTTIVNISSLYDRIGIWGMIAYCGSKAAVSNITKTMAVEFGELNIRVNCICPTIVKTPLLQSLSSEMVEKLAGTGINNRTLLKKKELEPSDIADAVLFLSSPLSCMITGTSLLLDAGFCAH